MKKTLLILLGVILLAAVGYWLFGGGEHQQAAQGGAQQARPLHAIRLSEQSITTYEELPGRTTAYKVAEIRPQVSGIITERLFKEGSAVEEGQATRINQGRPRRTGEMTQTDRRRYRVICDTAG